jgi:hypothetical protein
MIIEKNCLSLMFATSKLRNYLLNAKIHVMMIPLKILFNKTDLLGNLDKWDMLLMNFELTFFSQK